MRRHAEGTEEDWREGWRAETGITGPGLAIFSFAGFQGVIKTEQRRRDSATRGDGNSGMSISECACMCLSVCLFMYFSLYLSIYLSVCLSAYPSIRLRLSLSMNLNTSRGRHFHTPLIFCLNYSSEITLRLHLPTFHYSSSTYHLRRSLHPFSSPFFIIHLYSVLHPYNSPTNSRSPPLYSLLRY